MKDFNDAGKVERALSIARLAHKDQTRWDGSPYINHPISVASRFRSPLTKSIALLHDVVEDTHMTLNDLLIQGMDQEVVDGVDAITKRDGEEYVEYLKRVSENEFAGAVKIADIQHNLQDLKPGSMRDKYLLAIQFLILLNPVIKEYVH